jgi:hypothetical protein
MVIYGPSFSDWLLLWCTLSMDMDSTAQNWRVTQNFDSSIQFNYYYVDIFGDVATKMKNQWASKGGYEGFAVHIK